jgi:hypothetical protein
MGLFGEHSPGITTTNCGRAFRSATHATTTGFWASDAFAWERNGSQGRLITCNGWRVRCRCCHRRGNTRFFRRHIWLCGTGYSCLTRLCRLAFGNLIVCGFVFCSFFCACGRGNSAFTLWFTG